MPAQSFIAFGYRRNACRETQEVLGSGQTVLRLAVLVAAAGVRPFFEEVDRLLAALAVIAR